MAERYAVVGPPGTGKTTYLKRQVERAVAQLGPHEVMVCSLTRAAASEIKGRDLPIPADRVGTLHSFAYRALGCPPVAESKLAEWNTAHPQMALSAGKGVRSPEEDREDERGDRDAPGDELYEQMNLFRHRMLPRQMWWTSVQAFAKAWDLWLAESGYIDFTGMIEQAYQTIPDAPGRPLAMFVDEAQDMSALEVALASKWSAEASTVVFVGDPAQCQPAGTMVETTVGPVPIEELDPSLHRVIAFARHEKLITGRRSGGFSFEKAARPFSGYLLTVHVGERSTRCTENHRWLVKWTDETRRGDHHVVYLMQSGDRFRIGHCKLFTNYTADSAALHVLQRARLERADRFWILKVLPDKRQSYIYEQIVSAKFGLPEVPFIERNGVSQDVIDAVFAGLDLEELAERAHGCVRRHGLLVEYPFRDLTKDHGEKWSKLLKITAANIIPGLMMVPVDLGSRTPEWRPISAVTAVVAEDMTVYSLSVSRHETYIADGLCTHNSLYEWRAADPEGFFVVGDPSHRKVLGQSHRVPGVPHAAAVAWAGALLDGVEYLPKAAEGSVEEVDFTIRDGEAIADLAEQHLADPGSGTLMVQALCSYMLRPAIGALRERGIPFHNPQRLSRADWNPLGDRKGTSTKKRLLAFLTDDQTPETVGMWLPMLQSKDVLARGAKERIKDGMPENPAEIMSLFASEDVAGRAFSADTAWLLDHVTAEYRPRLSYPVEVISKRGMAALREPPRVMTGTVHSFKGGQASHVVVAPDLSPAAYGEHLDGLLGVRRAFYVAMTRTEDRLSILRPMSRRCVELAA